MADARREVLRDLPDLVKVTLPWDSVKSLVAAPELAKLKDFPGLTGPLTFGEDRQLRRPAFVMRVENGQVKTEKRYAAVDERPCPGTATCAMAGYRA